MLLLKFCIGNKLSKKKIRLGCTLYLRKNQGNCIEKNEKLRVTYHKVKADFLKDVCV